MEPRPVSEPWLPGVALLLALVVLGVTLKEIGRRTILDPRPAAATAEPEPAPVTHKPAGLAFPLAGFEHALRDNFHEKRGIREHRALDIMAPRGTPVRAVDDGEIAKLYRGPMAGNAIYQFDAARTRVYFYAHLDRYAPSIVEGQPVKRGDVIAYVGSTGNAPESAPHLHFSMHELGESRKWWTGKAVNPYPLLAGEKTPTGGKSSPRTPR